MFQFIVEIFGSIVRVIYSLTLNNYALTIIIFTILTKAILYPLSLKSMKSQEELKRVKPKYDEIIKKYKNDKQKQGEEVAKLYSEHKINPLGGCLPLLIQLPLIFAMFYIVRQPLTYVVQLPKEDIKIYTQQLLNKPTVSDNEMSMAEIQIANSKNIIDMRFLGLNLGDIPSDVFSKDVNKKANPFSLVIPVLSVILSIYQIKQMQKGSEMTEEQKQMQKTTNIMMPMLSGFISYTMPLALGIYWLLGSALQIAQQQLNFNILKKEEVRRIGGNSNEKNN